MRRTAVINQIRGLLLERGITLRQGRRHVHEALPGIVEDASAKLSGAVRVLLMQLKPELDHLQMRIDEANAVIQKIAGENEACRRLVTISGIGPVTATAVIAAIGNGAAFKKGRGFSAWLGIVPGEYSIVPGLRALVCKRLLTDPIPGGSKFVSITPGTWSCSAPPVGSTGVISCSLSTEAVNATQTITFVVKVTTPGNMLVNNTASVSAATFDPNLANNTSTLVSKVGP